MPDLVSILIPCHNAERWIGEAIGAALEQTWPAVEVIVVDDGSTDGSLGAARSLANSGRVRVLSQANRGAAAARNAARAIAAGQWLQYLDADDLLAPDKIASQLRSPPPPDTLPCGRWARFCHHPSEAQFGPEILCRDAAPVDWVVDKFEHHAMMHPAAWLVPRALSERAGPWDESLSLDDDGEYFTRLVLHSRAVRCYPEARSYYRSQIAGSLSARRSDAAWDSALRSLEASAAGLLAAEDSPRTRHACAAALTRFTHEAYPSAPDSRRRAATRAAALGGAEVPLLGGPRFQLLRRLLGWKLARRLQRGLAR